MTFQKRVSALLFKQKMAVENDSSPHKSSVRRKRMPFEQVAKKATTEHKPPFDSIGSNEELSSLPSSSVRIAKEKITRKSSSSRAKNLEPKSARQRKSRSHELIFVRKLRRWIVAVLIGIVISWGFYRFCVYPYSYRWKPCYGYQEYGVCLPTEYQVHGLDISHHQGQVDWDLLAYHHNPLFPLRFVFLKATEGGDLADEHFAFNFEQARAHGMIRGAYHYFIPKTDPLKQAEFFIRNVNLQQGDLPPVLDVERTGRLSTCELQERVLTWLQRVEHHYGVRPILYTGYKFRKHYLSDTLFDSYPYWIAHYYVDSVSYRGKWHFWQHTDVGRVPGISKRVDLNVFNGTLEELQHLTLQ